jgi:capsular polysaccharide biosynthesis protein
MKRRFRAGDFDCQQDDASEDDGPAPGTIVAAHTGVSTNGHGTPTLVEHVGDDIVVWPAADEDAWTSNGSSSASTVSLATESADADEADEWLGVGAASRFVNLHFILSAVQRRRRWVIGSAIAGLVVGLLLSVASAPTPQAETKVLLTFPSASDPARAMATDAGLLETDAVARRVVNALHLRESPAAFSTSYSGLGLSDNLLSISVSAPSNPEAVRRANALAHQYLAYRADVYQHQSNAIVEGLRKRLEAIQSQINEIDRQIGTQAGANTSTDPATARLQTQQDGLHAQYNALNDSIGAQTNSSAAVVAGSFAIDQATPVERSKIKELGLNALSGLAAGLGISLALVVLLAVTSNRVWRRDDVAEAMRHSVDLSTGPIHARRPPAKVTMKKLIAQPPPELTKVVAHLRHQLATSAGGDRSLAVIAVGGLEVAAASVCATATALARDGENVVVVDTSEQNIISSSRLLQERESETTDGDPGGRLRLVSLANRDEAPSTDTDQVVLVLASLDPAAGAERIRALAPNAVAIVTAGRSTMTTLRSVSDMLEVAHVELVSIVLVGSSPHDESYGRHTSQASAPTPNHESDTWSVSPAGP